MADEGYKGKDWILRMISLIQEDVRNLTEAQRNNAEIRLRMGNKYQTFFQKFPSLMMKIMDDGDNFDINRLVGMLDQMEAVHSGELDAETTNERMGQDYFDRYVRPHLSEKDGGTKGGKKKDTE